MAMRSADGDGRALPGLNEDGEGNAWHLPVLSRESARCGYSISLEDIEMTVGARIRFALAAVILAAVYFYLLVYLIGWMSAHERPSWWLGTFPSRHAAAIAWLVALHTAAVSLAAVPVAATAVIIARKDAVLLALSAAVLATAAAAIPSLSSTIWPIIWNSNPIFFVTDQAKLIVAVPFLAWVLRAASSHKRFERSRVVS
jgi:hypothetical protein